MIATDAGIPPVLRGGASGRRAGPRRRGSGSRSNLLGKIAQMPVECGLGAHNPSEQRSNSVQTRPRTNHRTNLRTEHRTNHRTRHRTSKQYKAPMFSTSEHFGNVAEDGASIPPPPPPHLRGGEGGGTLPLDPPTQPQPTPPVFRWRVVGRCPCCTTAWIIDIDSVDNPVASWPSPRKMVDALLCGQCQARKRVLYRGENGATLSLWSPVDVGVMLRNVEDEGMDFCAHVTKSRPVVDGDRPPIDQIEDVLSKFRRLSVVGDGYLRSVGIDWSKYIARARNERRKPKEDAE